MAGRTEWLVVRECELTVSPHTLSSVSALFVQHRLEDDSVALVGTRAELEAFADLIRAEAVKLPEPVAAPLPAAGVPLPASEQL